MSLSSNRDFFELVKAIGESKSKQEEDRIISEEVVFLKKKIPESGWISAVYVEMLGQDASFAYIKAVELCASSNITQKRVGYLAAALCFSPDHEFRFMLVNQIQRDMNSSNHLETCAALTAVCKIVTPDMVPAVIGDVCKLLKHDMEMVRKKAVCALHRLYQMDNDCLRDHLDKVRRVLCDRDPSVMGAALILLHSVILNDPQPLKDLVSSFTSILKQIIEHRLPREFDYHRIPAPWIQMHLLRILALLGRGDQSSSEGMYEVLVEVMRRADTGINVGYAIVYECVRTVTTIYPNPLLLDAAATAISRFIRSDSHNLKYIGIKGLATIVKDHPRYAADHQMAVIDCLEDPDETLKRKTLDLLFRMTNSVNVEFIVEKLLTFLGTATDDHFRTDLVGRITQCAERFAPSNSWFVSTIVRVFELAGDKVKMTVAQTLMQLIAEGSEMDDDEDDETGERRSFDDELRCHAVEDFLMLLDKPKIPDVLAQAISWVLGEYGYLSHTKTPEAIMVDIAELCKQTNDPSTRCYAISAIMKLVAQCGVCPPVIQKYINDFSKSSSLEVVQRCHEFRTLLKSGFMADVLPVDASCEDIEVDPNLPFLDGFVQKALNNGAVPYSPPSYLQDEDIDLVPVTKGGSTTSGFKIGPYEKPTLPPATHNPVMGMGANTNTLPPPVPAGDNAAAVAGGNANSSGQLLVGKGVPQVWGRKMEAPATPAPAAAQQPSTQPKSASPAPTQPQNEPAKQETPKTTPAAPETPREPTEKEKMAAMLFGGIGGSSTGVSRRSSAARRSSSSAGASPVTVQPSSPANVEKSQKAGTPTNTPAAAKLQPASASNDNIFDLLDMSTAPNPGSVQPAPQPAAPANMFDDMVTLSPSATANNTENKEPATKSNNDNIYDAFANMNISTSDPTLEPHSSSSFSEPKQPSYNPIRLTTAEFGGRWGQTPVEMKKVVRIGSGKTLQDVVGALVAGNVITHVESIPTTSEAIFATTLASSVVSPSAPLGSLLLIHMKYLAPRGECVLTVKSVSRDLGDELVELLSAKLVS